MPGDDQSGLGGRRLEPSLEGLQGGPPPQRPVRPLSVVVAAEPLELDPELANDPGRSLLREPLLEGLVEPLQIWGW